MGMYLLRPFIFSASCSTILDYILISFFSNIAISGPSCFFSVFGEGEANNECTIEWKKIPSSKQRAHIGKWSGTGLNEARFPGRFYSDTDNMLSLWEAS